MESLISEFSPRSTAVVTRFLYRAYLAAGLDSKEIFERSNIDYSRCDDVQYRVSHEKLLRMWEVAGELSGDPNFGLTLAAEVPAPPFNAVGYLAMTSKNLREVLEVMAKYSAVFSDECHFKTTEDSQFAKVSIDLSCGLVASRQHTDFWQLFFYRLLSLNIGWKLPLEEAGFRHEKPSDMTVYDDLFKCEIKFNQETNYLLFPKVYLDYETISADPAMHKVHEARADQQLYSLTEIGIVNKVKKIVFEYLPDENIELGEVAKRLNLTPRTVQRNLSDEGTTFKKIVDLTRKDYTISEIINTDLSISEIAFRLGYKDLSSFYRAFRRWTGVTPIVYRENCKRD